MYNIIYVICIYEKIDEKYCKTYIHRNNIN